MNAAPKIFEVGSKVLEGLVLIRANTIWQLIVMKSDEYFSIFHIHDLVWAVGVESLVVIACSLHDMHFLINS